MVIGKLVCDVIKAVVGEGRISVVTLNPLDVAASFTRLIQHFMKQIEFCHLNFRKLNVIGCKLFSRTAPSVQNPDVERRTICSLLQKFDQVLVSAVIATWFIIKMSYQIIIDPMIGSHHCHSLHPFNLR